MITSTYKKIVTLSLLMCSFLQAIDGELKIRSAAFFPSSKLFRCIYGKVGANIEIEGAVAVCDYAQLWANFDWFSKKGASIGFCNPTTITIPSFSFGLKVPFCVGNATDFYLGAGAAFSRIRIKNQSLCGCECVQKNAAGLVIKSGFNFDLQHCMFIDLFADYVYQSVRFQQSSNVGGLKLGLGIGVQL